MAELTVKELMQFFSTEEKPVTTSEFMTFWKSCSDEQKTEYKNSVLV